LIASSGYNDPSHWSTALTAGLSTESGVKVVFDHRGPVDHSVVEQAIAITEASSLAAGDPGTLRKRLVNVLVEAMENVHHHVDLLHRSSTFVLLLRTNAGYRLVLGNTLPVTTAALLLHRVEMLNEMDPEGLKVHYLALLANAGRTERGGAGLGLVTMARRCNRPLLARTYPIDRETAFFCLELNVMLD